MSVDLKAISKKNLARDLGLIALGSLVFAVGLNCFMEPNGLAPGGISGLAITLRAAVLAAGGPNLPVGMQTLVMNRRAQPRARGVDHLARARGDRPCRHG